MPTFVDEINETSLGIGLPPPDFITTLVGGEAWSVGQLAGKGSNAGAGAIFQPYDLVTTLSQVMRMRARLGENHR